MKIKNLNVTALFIEPCVATRRLFLRRFIYLFFYSVLRNYSTDTKKLCILCSLNNPVVLKFFGRHLADKNSENLVNFTGWLRFSDNNFETVKDNSNQTNWTRGIVSLHFWKIVNSGTASICPIGWQNLYFGHNRGMCRNYESPVKSFRPKLIVFRYLSHLTYSRVHSCCVEIRIARHSWNVACASCRVISHCHVFTSRCHFMLTSWKCQSMSCHLCYVMYLPVT